MIATGLRVADVFAGAGGLSLGLEMVGAEVVFALNHHPPAINIYQQNHPNTQVACEDAFLTDWHKLPAFDWAAFASSCQGHSQASQPRRRAYHDTMRATTWVVPHVLDARKPLGFILENVPDLLRWSGFPAWCAAVRGLGYHIAWEKVWATAYGVPQRRQRVFVVGSRSKQPVLRVRKVDVEPAFGPCIDWDVGEWRLVAGATPRVRERIARGQARCGERFLTQHVTDHPGVPLHEPIRTITCGDQWAVVDGERYRPLTLRENARAMGFPDTYGWPANASREAVVNGFGNATCPPKVAGFFSDFILEGGLS